MLQKFNVALLFLSILIVGCTNALPPKQKEIPDLLAVSKANGFELLPESSGEKSFLEFLVNEEEKTALRSVILLHESERVAAVYFLKSGDSPSKFLFLKEQAFDLFSSRMTNLVDDRIEREGYLPMDILAFTDPVLGESRFFFALVHDTLYEFHVAEGKENTLQGLLLEIARTTSP
jgi:hypothetical protein